MGLKVADSYFIDPDTGKEIEVLMRYTNSGDSIMQTPHNYFRMKNGKVEKQRDEDLWEEPNTEDPNYWLNNFKQAILNLQQPKRVVKYIWDKIFKQGQGGTMNYTQYLQDGGNMISEEVVELVRAAIEDDNKDAQEQIQSILQADEDGDEQVKEIANQIRQVISSLQGQDVETTETSDLEAFKCGGKVRAKVKKACKGNKFEKGAKVPVAKKGCPCQYRRVGGRLQLVDCNGVPVAKNGAVLYAGLGDKILATAKKYNYNPFAIAYNVTKNTAEEYYPVVKQSYRNAKKAITNLITPDQNENVWTLNPNGTFSKAGDDLVYYGYRGDNGGVKMLTADQVAAKKAAEDAAARRSGSGTKSAGQLMFERELPGALSDYSLSGRRAWMRSAENADAIRDLGFTADNYTGTPELNRALLAAMKNRAAVAAEPENTTNVYGNDMTNRQLLDYNPNAEGAQALSEDAAARRLRLLAAEQANTARQRSALTLRGKEYADEHSYNLAVADYNSELTNKAWQDAIASGYSGRDVLKANRYQQTGNRLLDDARLLTILRRQDINEQERQTALNTYLKDNYKGADYLRASQIMSNYTPATLATNYVKPKELAIDWNATTFAKNGGKLISYADYLK